MDNIFLPKIKTKAKQTEINRQFTKEEICSSEESSSTNAMFINEGFTTSLTSCAGRWVAGGTKLNTPRPVCVRL